MFQTHLKSSTLFEITYALMILFCQTILLLIAYRIWIQILHLLIIKHSMSSPLRHWFSWRTTILNDEKWCTHVLHWYGLFPSQLTRFCLWRTIYIYIFPYDTQTAHRFQMRSFNNNSQLNFVWKTWMNINSNRQNLRKY